MDEGKTHQSEGISGMIFALYLRKINPHAVAGIVRRSDNGQVAHCAAFLSDMIGSTWDVTSTYRSPQNLS